MKAVKHIFSSVKNWVKGNPTEFLILFFIIVLGAFLRLYKISEYMTFLGDEGRDVIIVRRLLVEHDPIFVGPGTSVGNMHLGPLYYYMIAPALLLANFSPIGPAVEIALLGVVTIFFIWFVTRKWFGVFAASLASFFYAISPVVIYHSRSSWNPNIMPFFALLLIYSLWKVWQEAKWNWLMVTAISFSFVVQSHYLGLILLPTMLIFIVLSLIRDYKDKALLKVVVRNIIVAMGIFLALMSSLIIFDAKYGWRNALAMKNFFTQNRADISFNLLGSILRLWSLSVEFITRVMAGRDGQYGQWLLMIIVALLLFFILRWKDINKTSQKAIILVGVWLAIGILGLSLYKQRVFDHYYGFIFPAPFIFLGGLLETVIKRKNKAIVFLVTAGFLLLTFINIKANAFWDEPNRQLLRTSQVAEKIREEAGGQKFNLAVIAERNYEGAYQYFLELKSAPISFIDPQRYEETVAEQLFVVCEYENHEKCQPTSNPKAEVANFGWSKVEQSWDVGGLVIFKLVHNRQI